MKYLKKFNVTSEYDVFKNSEDYILPNVSFVVENTIVKFNPNAKPASPNIVCTYNVTDISQETKILHSYGLPYVTNMIVDGVEMEAETYYQFDTTGLHTVEFILDDPTTTGNNTFNECSNLTTITIPDSVTSIGEYGFNSCSSLTSITIPDSVTSIGNSAFSYCSNLTSINIPDGVTYIGNSAFYNCSNLTSINIPDSVTSIGYSTFQNCSGLTSVHIGSGVTAIDYSAFESCSDLNEIICNAITAPSIDMYTFYDIKSDSILKVPAGSDYSSWMNTSDYYLGYYNWTIEYI